jgi:hypothetical protein
MLRLALLPASKQASCLLMQPQSTLACIAARCNRITLCCTWTPRSTNDLSEGKHHWDYAFLSGCTQICLHSVHLQHMVVPQKAPAAGSQRRHGSAECCLAEIMRLASPCLHCHKRMGHATVQSAMCRVQCAECNVQSAMCRVQCAECNVQSAMCRVQRAEILSMVRALCTSHSARLPEYFHQAALPCLAWVPGTSSNTKMSHSAMCPYIIRQMCTLKEQMHM